MQLNPIMENTSWLNQPRFGGEEIKPLAPHIQRVVDEKDALDEKLTKLDTFIQMNPLLRQCSEAEQDRLRRQSSIMHDYSDVLGERISAFPVAG